MSDENPKVDEALSGIGQERRATLTKLITGSAFVAPIVASFAISSLSINSAEAQSGNGSGITSDRRLKTDIVRLATDPAGFGLYRFKYLWSDAAYVGVLAQEVLDVAPDAVSTGPDGFLRVDYRALGLDMMPYESWKSREVESAQCA